jgi:hypothetical protein
MPPVRQRPPPTLTYHPPLRSSTAQLQVVNAPPGRALFVQKGRASASTAAQQRQSVLVGNVSPTTCDYGSGRREGREWPLAKAERRPHTERLLNLAIRREKLVFNNARTDEDEGYLLRKGNWIE